MQYLIQRLLSAIPVVLGISIIVFLIISLIPGDPATAILGSFATPDNVAKLNKDLGLDQGLVERYFIWLGNLMQGDFGRSYALNRPVIDEILERFNATLILSGTAFVLCSLFGIIIGTISAAKQYTFTDKIITLGKKDTLINTKALVSKLQDINSANKVKKNLAKRYEKRKGGYTRIIKAGFRYGDNAPMAVIEFVDRDVEAKRVNKKKKENLKDNKEEKKIATA